MQGIYIFTNIILPIFLQIAAGYVLKRIFDFSLKPLVTVQLYIIIPALMFVKICEAQMNGNMVFLVFVHTLLLFCILCLIGVTVAHISKMRKSMGGAFVNSIVYYNCGNYSIPLVELLYGNGIAMMVQIFIMTIQNVLFNLFGVLIACSGKQSLKKSLVEMLKIPMLYSAVIAFILRFTHITVPKPVWYAMDSLGSALVPIALISLGAQLLVISAAAPTATNIALIAIQYDAESEFVAQSIFISTVLSALTIILVILVAQTLL